MPLPPGIGGCLTLPMHMVSAHQGTRVVVRDCNLLASWRGGAEPLGPK